MGCRMEGVEVGFKTEIDYKHSLTTKNLLHLLVDVLKL